VSIIPPLRILFIVLAFLIGIGLIAGAALSVWDLLEVVNGVVDQPAAVQQPDGTTIITNPYGLDGPPPFSFSSYGYVPFIGAIVFLSGLAALKRRWETLALTCWFLLGGVVLVALYSIWSLGWDGLIFAFIPNAIGAAWVCFPLLGLWLATVAGSRGEIRPGEAPSASSQDRIRLRNTLVGLAVLSYLLRIVTIALTPGAISALAYFRGTSDAYLIVGSVLGLGAALLLLVGILRARRDNGRLLSSMLAFTAGLAFEGFLVALDLTSGLGARLELVYALQDAVAFVACCAALALSVFARGPSSRPAVA
jgi:hypothetical protein